jgi:hypothetical protein
MLFGLGHFHGSGRFEVRGRRSWFFRVEIVGDVGAEVADRGDVGAELILVRAVFFKGGGDEAADFESDFRGPVGFGGEDGQGRGLIGAIAAFVGTAFEERFVTCLVQGINQCRVLSLSAGPRH